jgi:hypothetical protein
VSGPNLQKRYSYVVSLLLRAQYLMGNDWPESAQLLERLLDKLAEESSPAKALPG